MASATLPPVHPSVEKARQAPPRILIVDDEPEVLAVLNDLVGRQLDCSIVHAATVAEAKRQINRDGIELMITDLALPDGDGMALVSHLNDKQPSAASIVITGKASVDTAVGALRAGAVDFIAKPFTSEQILDRVRRAIRRQNLTARNDRRILRLKDAVRRLNQSRKVVSKKVDLLCNDLISAYGDLARQVEDLRNQESFRKLLDSSKDLEQMLCHAMDWLLRNAGYCNLAVWLGSDDSDFQLGAYMKYTIAGEPSFTEAMKLGIVPMVAREGLVQLEGYDVRKYLTPAEYKTLDGNTILGVNCTYLGESLAVLVLFRDEKCPFTPEDVAMLKAIAPLFATALAAMVRKHEGSDDDPSGNDDTAYGGLSHDEGEPGDSDPDEKRRRQRRRKEQHDADWWKRGDPPPF